MQLQQLIGDVSLPDAAGTPALIGNLPGPAEAAAIAAAVAGQNRPVLVLCATALRAQILSQELRALMPSLPIALFPDRETLPYDQISPYQELISARLEVLATLPHRVDGVIFTSVNAVMPRLCPEQFIGGQSFMLKVGDRRSLTQMAAELTRCGYAKVDQVLAPGEFARRGSLLDLFAMGTREPYRIDFLDDEVDTISTFDPETQRSAAPRREIRLLPAHEFPLDEAGVSAFRSNYRDAFPHEDLKNHTVYQAISRGAVPAGVEYYLPLFFARMSTFFEYLPADCPIITVEDVAEAARQFAADAAARAEQARGYTDRHPLPPDRLFLSPAELTAGCRARPQLQLYATRAARTPSSRSLKPFGSAAAACCYAPAPRAVGRLCASCCRRR